MRTTLFSEPAWLLFEIALRWRCRQQLSLRLHCAARGKFLGFLYFGESYRQVSFVSRSTASKPFTLLRAFQFRGACTAFRVRRRRAAKLAANGSEDKISNVCESRKSVYLYACGLRRNPQPNRLVPGPSNPTLCRRTTSRLSASKQACKSSSHATIFNQLELDEENRLARRENQLIMCRPAPWLDSLRSGSRDAPLLPLARRRLTAMFVSYCVS